MSQSTGQLLELALTHHRAGRLVDAEAVYRQVLAADADQPDALHLLGLVALQVGKPKIAIELMERAIARRKDFPAAQSNLGFAYQSAGRWAEAIAAYRRAIELSPDLAEARVNLGNALCETGKHAEAIDILARAIELRPGDPNAHNSLGTALRGVRRLEEAELEFEKALSLDPNHAEAHNNLGNTLRDLDRQDQAIEHFQRAISLRPDYGQSVNNLGGAYEELGQYDLAIGTYRRAIQIQPQLHMAHVNLGIALLRMGDFHNGWMEYEWRYRDPEVAPLLSQSDRPIWDGSDLVGKTILIHAEQGLGDTIQFVRYLPLVAQRGGRVILRCLPTLIPLLKEVWSIDQLIAISDPIPEHDVQCPLLSLPRLFKTDLASIPAEIPYLHGDPRRAARWDERLSPFHDHLKVGLCWAGRLHYQNDRRRSIPPHLLAGLSEVASARFISLQKLRSGTNDFRFEISDWTEDMHDFADTAALIEGLDLIISVDTSVAHLAGAMGKPVWILLPFMPDWRWLLDRTDSPWYPSARLFRQTTRGDWATPIARAIDELKSFPDPSGR